MDNVKRAIASIESAARQVGYDWDQAKHGGLTLIRQNFDVDTMVKSLWGLVEYVWKLELQNNMLKERLEKKKEEEDNATKEHNSAVVCVLLAALSQYNKSLSLRLEESIDNGLINTENADLLSWLLEAKDE